MSETWYARSAAGAACGPGTRRALQQSAGTTPATENVSSEHTWNRVESARTIQAGNWSFLADLTTASGGGAPNRVTVVCERRNSSCVVQQTIGSVEVTMSAGTTQEYTFNFGDPGAVTFEAGDILTVRIVRTNGARAQTLRFDDDPTTDADSRLIHPDASVSISGDMAATEAKDAAEVDGDVEWVGNLAAVEPQDAASANGTVAWIGNLAATEPKDVLAATGSVLVEGDMAVVEPKDTAAITGTVASSNIEGDLSAVEPKDSFAAQGVVLVEGSLAAIEAADTAAASGIVEWVGILASTEAKDSFSGQGFIPAVGDMAVTEPKDIAAFDGTVEVSDITGDMSATEPPDEISISGVIAWVGSLSAHETRDVFAASGFLPIEGFMAIVEPQDIVSVVQKRRTRIILSPTRGLLCPGCTRR